MGPNEIPEHKCPLRTSLQADIFALRKIAEYRGGAVLQWAWVTTGYVTEEEMADWKYGGDMDALVEAMQRGRGGYKEFMRLTEVPVVDPKVHFLLGKATFNIMWH